MSNKWLHIKRIAEFIALQYEEKEVPLEKIIQEEGLNVFYDNYEKNTFDGMTIYHNENFYIHINLDMGNRKDSERGRFTLAHELGHYFIDAHRLGLKLGMLLPHPSKTKNIHFNLIERQADYFAACLLMPEEKFKKDIFKQKFNIELINFLKSEYKVSFTACSLRFADIGNHPIMIVYAEDNIIKWKHCSEYFPYKYLINGSTPPKDTVMSEYFRDLDAEIYKTEKIWAVDCFDYVKEEDFQKMLYEHCIAYNKCALSIYWED